ncbi:TPA: hypothetical protein ACX14B_002071 [Citrobacter freundii]
MRMKWENIPEKDASINVLQHSPYDRSGSLGYGIADCGSLWSQIDIPTLGVLAHVNIVGQS